MIIKYPYSDNIDWRIRQKWIPHSMRWSGAFVKMDWRIRSNWQTHSPEWTGAFDKTDSRIRSLVFLALSVFGVFLMVLILLIYPLHFWCYRQSCYPLQPWYSWYALYFGIRGFLVMFCILGCLVLLVCLVSLSLYAWLSVLGARGILFIPSMLDKLNPWLPKPHIYLYSEGTGGFRFDYVAT